MRSRTRQIIGPALLGLLLAMPAMAQTQSVTLGEAVARSNRVQPRVVQAEGTLRNADMRVKTAKGSFLPNLTANGSGSSSYNEVARANTSGDLQPPGSIGNLNASLSSTLEIWDGFRRSNDLKSARANNDAAEAGLRDASFQQALTTTNQFFDALAARKLVEVRQASLRRAEEQHKISVAKLQAGAATRSDSLRSFVGVGTAQLQLVNQMSTLATAEANLGRLIGESGRVEATDDSAFYRLLATVDTAALRAEALSASPTVISSEANVRAADASYKSAKSPYWPSLNLTANGSLAGNSERNNYAMLSNRSISLGVQWQLFNRFTREQNLETQAVNADIARANYDEARRAVQANITQRTTELEAARLRIEITQRSLEAAREDLRVQQERYRLGVSTILDVLTTTEALTQAEVDQVNSRFDYLRAKAAIEAIIGRSL